MHFKLRNFAAAFVWAMALASVTSSTVCIATELDPTLNRTLYLIDAYRKDATLLNLKRLEAFGLPEDANPTIRFFLYFDQAPSTLDYDYLSENSIRVYPHTYLPPVGFHRFGYLIAEAKVSAIKALVASGKYPRLCAAGRKLSPKNDLTAIETGVAEARQWDPPLLGQGVRLAILDSGFRFDHPDLPDPAQTMDYSAFPDTNRDATDHVSGHGTHVAGTAFGIGSLAGGRWMGMAPKVDPIYFKIGDDESGDASSEAVIGAIRGAATWADADILSMSYGGSDGFNDGTSAEEQAVDWAVGQGVSVFMSAGNSAGDQTHYSIDLPANSFSEPIQLISRFGVDSTTWGISLSWFDGADTSTHLEISARIFDGNDHEIEIDAVPPSSSPRGTEYREYLARQFLPIDSTSFFIQINNLSDVDQKVHLRSVTSHWYLRFAEPDRGTSVLLPSTADSCISVGAFTTRIQWMDYLGDSHLDRAVTGEIAGFSSVGPRIDGRLKPDICAPGKRIISCRDLSNIELDDGLDYVIISTEGDSGLPADYVAFMGTSMSSPAASGAAAIILQGKPESSPAELRNLIFQSARIDQHTGEVPNNTWGWGKIDVVRALEIDYQENMPLDLPEAFCLLGSFPNPTNGAIVIRYESLSTVDLIAEVFDITGRSIWRETIHSTGAGVQTILVPEEVFPTSGVFYTRLSDSVNKATNRVTIVR